MSYWLPFVSLFFCLQTSLCEHFRKISSCLHHVGEILRIFFEFCFSLCPALKSIFEHGMKRQSFLGGSYHPWHFIEEVNEFGTIKMYNKKM